MKKRIKKGITLIELIVSISVSSVIFVGITGLLLFLRNSNTDLKNDAQNFYNANTLSHAISSVLDEGNHYLLELPDEPMIIEDDLQDDLPGVEAATQKLFSVKKADITLNYYFYKQHFGYTTAGSLIFNNVYTSLTKVKLEFTPPTEYDSNEYTMVFNYGASFDGHVTVIKNLYESM